jgi:hypothetical protein
LGVLLRIANGQEGLLIRHKLVAAARAYWTLTTRTPLKDIAARSGSRTTMSWNLIRPIAALPGLLRYAHSLVGGSVNHG